MLTFDQLNTTLSNILTEFTNYFDFDKTVPIEIFIGKSYMHTVDYCDNNYLRPPTRDEFIASWNTLYKTTAFKNVARYHLIISYDFWKDSTRDELTGCVIHELAHGELDYTSRHLMNLFVDNNSMYEKNPIESINDMLCINKGLTKYIVKTRKFLEKKLFQNFTNVQEFPNSCGLDLSGMIRLLGKLNVEIALITE